jgi:hypothetical protein
VTDLYLSSENIADITIENQSEISEDTRIELLNARYMALNYEAISETATSLCRWLAQETAEADPERKRGRRGQKLEQFESAVTAVLADLIIGYSKKLSSMSYRTVSPNGFTGSSISHRNFTSIMRGFRALGFIEEPTRGFYDRSQISMGKATRFKPSLDLLTICSQWGVAPGDHKDHFAQAIPPDPIVLRASKKQSGRLSARGRKMNFEPTDTSLRFTAEVEEINEFVSQFEIEGANHAGFQRIFNQGDTEGFNWNKGGRLQSVGGGSYQSLSNKDRKEITINGEQVVEVDIRASHLTIVYELMGQSLDFADDPYEIEGFPRDIVKKWITMTFGYNKLHRAWPGDAKEELAEKGITELQKAFPIAVVRSAVFKRHPIIQDWLDSPYDCFDLMFIESEKIIKAMLALKRDHGVVSLPVHDSLIVSRQYEGLAEELLFRSTSLALP